MFAVRAGRGAGRRRRQDDVDVVEKLEHLRAIPAPEFLRLHDERRRNQDAGDQPVAHRGIEVLGAAAQPVEMQRRTFGRRDDIGRRARALGFGDFDFAADVERRGDPLHRLAGFRRGAFAEIAAGHRDPQAFDAAIEREQRRLDRPLGADRIVGIVSLHGVIGQREIP